MVKKLVLTDYIRPIIISDTQLYIDEDIEYLAPELYDKRFPVTKHAVLVTQENTIYEVVDYMFEHGYELTPPNDHGICGVFNFDGKIIYMWVSVERDVDENYDGRLGAWIEEAECTAALSAGFLWFITRLSKKDVDSLFSKLRLYAINKAFKCNEDRIRENSGNRSVD